MGFDVSSLADKAVNKGKSVLLNKTNKLISSLDSVMGVDSNVKPKYIYPNDIDRQSSANYMVIYIYDHKNNTLGFESISSQIAKSKVQTDLVKQLKDSVSIKVSDGLKDKLKSYESKIKERLESSFKDIFSTDIFDKLGDRLGLNGKWEIGGLNLGDVSIGDAAEWVKRQVEGVSDFLSDNALTRYINGIADEFDLPNITDYIPNLSGFVDIDIDESKIKDALVAKKNELLGQYGFISNDKVEKDEALDKFNLVSSIILPLPENEIKYSSKIGINAVSTKLAAAVVQSFQAGLDASKNEDSKLLKFTSGLIGAGTEVGKIISQQGAELGYSLLGEQGNALYQQNENKIRDPLYAFTYSIPDPRTFQYNFVMAPRSKKELYDIWDIIKTLKFYSHMEVVGKKSVRYYKFPARFRIKYYTEGNENVWLGKTKTLGLTGIESNIDTSNIGFIANDFDKISGNPPKMISLSLTFTELSILNRKDINEGY